MDNIKVNSNAITIDFGRKLKPKQIFAIKGWLADRDTLSAISYIESINGKRARNLYVDRYKRGGKDPLASREPNSILAILQKRFDVNEAHKPTSSHTTWVGVEIECFVPYGFEGDVESIECEDCCGDGEIFDEDDETYNNCNNCDGSGIVDNSDIYLERLGRYFKDNKIKYINIKYDGSIEPKAGYFAVEVTVLTKIDDMSNLKKVCSLLNKVGAEVNKSCGMHVHLDARHLDSTAVKSIGRKFKRCLPLLLSMVPVSRRDNYYCKPRVSTIDGNRYAAVNLTAYRKFKTIEVRLHSSTTDFKKIQHWIVLLTQIAASTKLPLRVDTIEKLTEYIYIPEETMEYCTQRVALFNNQECKQEFKDNDNTESISGDLIVTSSSNPGVGTLISTPTVTRSGLVISYVDGLNGTVTLRPASSVDVNILSDEDQLYTWPVQPIIPTRRGA